MKVLLVLGHGHPGHGMGDSPGWCTNWVHYINRIAVLAKDVDLIVLAGGPILESASSEAEAMYRWFGYYHEELQTQKSFILEMQSLLTFENFEFTEQLLRGYSPVTELTILGAYHKQISYLCLGAMFFPHVCFTRNLRIKTQRFTSERKLWKDITSVNM